MIVIKNSLLNLYLGDVSQFQCELFMQYLLDSVEGKTHYNCANSACNFFLWALALDGLKDTFTDFSGNSRCCSSYPISWTRWNQNHGLQNQDDIHEIYECNLIIPHVVVLPKEQKRCDGDSDFFHTFLRLFFFSRCRWSTVEKECFLSRERMTKIHQV